MRDERKRQAKIAPASNVDLDYRVEIAEAKIEYILAATKFRQAALEEAGRVRPRKKIENPRSRATRQEIAGLGRGTG